MWIFKSIRTPWSVQKNVVPPVLKSWIRSKMELKSQLVEIEKDKQKFLNSSKRDLAIIMNTNEWK
jgi:hypothetical protein